MKHYALCQQGWFDKSGLTRDADFLVGDLVDETSVRINSKSKRICLW